MSTVVVPIDPADVRQQLFVDLYQRAFPAVARFVSRHGGSLEAAQDVFQDALVLYYEKIVREAADGPAAHHDVAYLLGIARHRWIKQYHRAAPEVPLETSDAVFRTEESAETPARRKLLRFLTVAGQRCMDLLRAFYYDQLPLAEVANTFGYSGVRSATVQKYKCLEKVRHTVREKSLCYEDFLEED